MRFLIALALLASVQAYFQCPQGYTSNSIQKKGQLTHYCYKIYAPNSFTRHQARAQCLQDGANLASISSVEENQMYISALLSTTYTSLIYFGLGCADDNNCAFDDGTPYNASIFTGFDGDRPKTQNGYCAYLITLGNDAGKWEVGNCEIKIGAFVCKYDPNPAISKQSGCNSLYILDETPLIITSPHYPKNYDDFQTCSYFIQGNTSALFGINITFTDFHTEVRKDVLRIRNGGYRHNSTLIGEYSGKKTPFTVLTDDYESLITFISDNIRNFPGFSAIVSSYRK